MDWLRLLVFKYVVGITLTGVRYRFTMIETHASQLNGNGFSFRVSAEYRLSIGYWNSATTYSQAVRVLPTTQGTIHIDYKLNSAPQDCILW